MTIAALAAKYRVIYRRAYEIVCGVAGPPASLVGRLTLADRDAKIAAAYFNGVTIRELAQQYAVTLQRIRQIVGAKALGSGEEGRPDTGDVVIESKPNGAPLTTS